MVCSLVQCTVGNLNWLLAAAAPPRGIDSMRSLLQTRRHRVPRYIGALTRAVREPRPWQVVMGLRAGRTMCSSSGKHVATAGTSHHAGLPPPKSDIVLFSTSSSQRETFP